MIKVILRNNVGKVETIADENSTLRTVLEDNEVNYTSGVTSLDGASLKPGDLDKTFADFGITDKCWLLNVVKADNA